MPSSARAIREVRKILETLEFKPHETIYDCGSGFGHIALLLAKRYPEVKVVGYELAWIPYLFSKMISFFVSNLTIERKDFLKEDLSQAAFIYTYLYPAMMQQIANRLQWNGYLLSFNFALPGKKALLHKEVGRLQVLSLYLYEKR